MHRKNGFINALTFLFAIGLIAMSLVLISCGDESKEQENTGTGSGYISQTSTAGDITVTATPGNLGEDASTWSFNITMDAGNGDLGEDMLQAAVIVGTDGTETGPTAWEGDGPGGLHRQGVLKFDSLKPMPKSITLKIRGVGGIGERSFSWILGQ
ncbi:MAG: hypothetical protein WC911_09670 [Thermoleophilia bacterium]